MLYLDLLCLIPLLFAIVNSLTMRVIKHKDALEVSELVSILIPMRNEEKNVRGVLDAVTASLDLSQAEVIVLNDHSSDATGELLGGYSTIEVIPGKELPESWLGKNFACHQLAVHATGDYLVFVDADVRVSPHAIAATITSMNEFGWDFISAYPAQLANSFFERLIQPLLQWSWLSSVPLRFAERGKFPSMVIANGQFLIVKRSAYLASGGHKAIKGEVLDDLELARLLVRHGYQGGVAEASQVARCHMYENRQELFNGYTKSLWRGFGSPIGAIVAAVYLLVTGVLPFVLALSGYREAWFGYFAVVLSRLVSTMRTRSTSSDLLHPIAILVFIYLLALSFYKKSRGQLTWRGRSVN